MPAWAELPVPPLRGRINDLANVLDAAAAARLERSLADFEAETTHQIAVLTVPSLAGEPIEPFAFRVAEAWRLGHEGADNGILVVVAPRDRRARIEVGYGLEGAVPDAIARRIIAEGMAPHFQRGDFGAGIEAGVGALMEAARHEPVSLPPARRGAPHEDPLSVVFFAALLGSLLASPLRRARRPAASLAGGGVGGGIAWLLLASLGWAAAAFAIAFALGLVAPGAVGGGPGRRRWGPVFVPGGGWGGGFGGGGGGFRGGGGRFGGGGASGSW